MLIMLNPDVLFVSNSKKSICFENNQHNYYENVIIYANVCIYLKFYKNLYVNF